MTDLDTLARAAARELLDRTAPDVATRRAEITRIRSRRTTAKLAAVCVAVALAAGGWQLASSSQRRAPQPAPAPTPASVVNGALVGLGVAGEWTTLSGRPPAFQPRDAEQFATVQFTRDGRSMVYQDTHNRITSLDAGSGEEHVVADCPAATSCMTSSLSPDGGLLALGSDDGVELVHLDTGELEHVQPAGIGWTTFPSWSPDGALLAFVSGPRLYTMRPDGTGLATVLSGDDPDTQFRSLSWSPDGSSIAFIEGTPIAGNRKKQLTDDRFTAMTVGVADHAVTGLHDAGHCYCLGLAPPSLTWSPDGDLIAVATTEGMLGGPDERAVGVYTIHPDGTGWSQVAAGLYDALAWQPVID